MIAIESVREMDMNSFFIGERKGEIIDKEWIIV